MRRLALASVFLLGCFDWDVLSSTLDSPDLSVLDDLAVPADLAASPDLSLADLRMPDLALPPDMTLPVVSFTKQLDPASIGGKKPNNALFGWNTSNLTAVGDSGVVVSTTDGKTWAPVTIAGLSQNLQDIWFSGDGSSGWIVGSGTTAYTWVNPGTGFVWQSKNMTLSSNLFAVFGTANDKVVTGGDQNNTAFRWVTSWTTETRQNFNTNINGIWGTGQTFHLVNAGSSNCLIFTDTTNTKVPCGLAGNGVLETVWGIDTSNVFAAGYEGSAGVVAKYDGSKWAKATLPSVVSTIKLYSVWAAATNDIWAGGEKGTVLHFDGKSWLQVNAMGIAGTEIIKDIWGADANNVWFLTDAGTIYKKN